MGFRLQFFVLIAVSFLVGTVNGASDLAVPFKVLTMKRVGESLQVGFYQVEGLWMNQACRDNLARCQAYLASKKAVAKRKPAPGRNSSRMANPAATNCHKDGGAELTLFDESGSEVGICGFKDQTLIDSWDLLRAQQGVSRGG